MMKGGFVFLWLLISSFAFGQKPDNDMADGNEAFDKKDYRDAEADYRISQSASPTKADATYNLGNAVYRQKYTSEAITIYAKAIKNAKTKSQKHKAYHNMGNAFMKNKNYQYAIEAYKDALRNNPADEETRYNYALAKKMLKDNPPPQPKKDDRKDPPQKDKEDNKSNVAKNRGDSGEKADGGGSKDTPDKGGGGAGQQQSKGGAGQGDPKPASEDPDKQRMESLLDAMNNEERKIQERVNGVKVKTQPKRNEKDW